MHQTETRDKLISNLNSTDVKFVSLDKKKVAEDFKKTARAASGVLRDFEARRRLLTSLVFMIKRFFSLVFLRIIYLAAKYHRKYLNDIEFDNVYITPYFRRIEARRKARGSSTLLPLKKLERVKIMDPYSLRQSRRERRSLLGQTAKLVLEIMTTSVFILFDEMLYEALVTVRTHGKLEIRQVLFSAVIDDPSLVASSIVLFLKFLSHKNAASQKRVGTEHKVFCIR